MHHPFDLTVFYSISTTPYMVNLQRFLLSDGAPRALLRATEFRKNSGHVARTSDIFGWNLCTKNVDIYRS